MSSPRFCPAASAALCLALVLALPAAGQETPSPPAPTKKAESVEDALFRARIQLLERLLDKDMDAKSWRRLGDWHKGEARFPEAAIHYLIALRTNPKSSYAAYQLACTFSLWGQKDLALEWLERAVALGFWGFPVIEDDDDLEAVRADARFKACLAKVKAAYPAAAKKHAGAPLVALPKDRPKPAKGWPVLVFLHGWGDEAQSYETLAADTSKLGLAGVALPGAVPLMEGSYRWHNTSYAETHTYVQKHLAGLAAKGIDTKRVYLLGFSQGALHAAGLLANFPDHYRGGVILSPGGSVPLPAKVASPERARRMVLSIGGQEHESNKAKAKALETLWRAAKWPVEKIEHEGGHTFPKDFDERFAKLVAWLRAG